jgi:hypothetical protein
MDVSRQTPKRLVDRSFAGGATPTDPTEMFSSSLRRIVVAAALLPFAAAVAQTGKFPWHAGDKPPAFAGFTLGQSLDSIRNSFGKKVHVDSAGAKVEARVYTFSTDTRSISVSALRKGGVGVITVRDRTVGAIDGVRVGDVCTDVVKKWGKPTRENPNIGQWIAGRWLVSARCSPKHLVVELTMGNTA